LSTKNISLPKGRARKLAPKYLGPFPILGIIKEGATYRLGLSDELTKRGVNPTFHASLLRPHVPNDDRRFPGRMPIQIPGFGESPGEWIVDGIVTHHGKGRRSEFQILWKAGDKSWASYQEVAHLNALKQYCELMGVEDVSDLPSNYVSRELESESEEIIFRSNACTVREEYKETSDSMDQPIEQPSSTLLSNAMIYSTLAPNDLRDCLAYERRLNASRNGTAVPPMNPPPKWDEFQAEQSVLTAGRHPVDHGTYPRYPQYHQPAADNVSMPAETLETIIRIIGNATRAPPAPLPRAPPAPKYAPRRPAPPPNHARGRGGSGGRGGGQANRRGKRSNPATRDPRRNHGANTTPIPIPTPPPIASTSTAPAVTIIAEATPQDDDIAFFSEFANAEIGSGNDLDIVMNGENNEAFIG